MDVTSVLDLIGRPQYLQQRKYAADGYDFGTRESAFVSAVRAFVKRAGAEVLDEALSYARFWNIEKDVLRAQEKVASLQERPEPREQDYALNVKLAQQSIQKFAAYNAGSTRLAASAFHDSRHRLPYAWRKEASTELLARARKYNAVLPEYLNASLEKSAGYGVATAEGLQQALNARAMVLHRREGQALDKLGQFFHQLSSDDAYRWEMTPQVLETLDLFDRQTKIAQYYETGELDLPEEVIDVYSRLSVLEKAAAEALPNSVELVNGWSVNPLTLDKTALAVVDPSLAGVSDRQLVEILPTLPRPDADLLQRLVS